MRLPQRRRQALVEVERPLDHPTRRSSTAMLHRPGGEESELGVLGIEHRLDVLSREQDDDRGELEPRAQLALLVPNALRPRGHAAARREDHELAHSFFANAKHARCQQPAMALFLVDGVLDLEQDPWLARAAKEKIGPDLDRLRETNRGIQGFERALNRYSSGMA